MWDALGEDGQACEGSWTGYPPELCQKADFCLACVRAVCAAKISLSTPPYRSNPGCSRSPDVPSIQRSPWTPQERRWEPHIK